MRRHLKCHWVHAGAHAETGLRGGGELSQERKRFTDEWRDFLTRTGDRRDNLKIDKDEPK